jgi:hypothetical protein
MQAAFVVEDIERAMKTYHRRLDVGPWFLFKRFTPGMATYRGRRTNLVISVAFAYRDDLMLELIEQHDNSRSVFREAGRAPRYGFHHFGLTTTRYQRLVDDYVRSGYEIEFTAETSGRLAIMRTRDLAHRVEILELTDKRRALFDRIRAASRRWNGSDPVRSN